VYLAVQLSKLYKCHNKVDFEFELVYTCVSKSDSRWR